MGQGGFKEENRREFVYMRMRISINFYMFTQVAYITPFDLLERRQKRGEHCARKHFVCPEVAEHLGR